MTSPRVRPTLQTAAAAWCVLMVLLLSGVQLFTQGPGMPPQLWLVFSAVWVFGAAMLWWFPMFGASGTAIYGLILGVNVLTMHGTKTSTVLIAAGSFGATALCLALLWQRMRAKSPATRSV